MFAMVTLFVASLGLGVYAKMSNKIANVSADVGLNGLPQSESVCRTQPVPLKAGLNRFENNGTSFSLEDRVVVVGGEAMSFIEAQKRDIIGTIRNITKDRNLQAGVLGVSIGDEFSLTVIDSSVSPELCLKGIK